MSQALPYHGRNSKLIPNTYQNYVQNIAKPYPPIHPPTRAHRPHPYPLPPSLSHPRPSLPAPTHYPPKPHSSIKVRCSGCDGASTETTTSTAQSAMALREAPTNTPNTRTPTTPSTPSTHQKRQPTATRYGVKQPVLVTGNRTIATSTRNRQQIRYGVNRNPDPCNPSTHPIATASPNAPDRN